ncbi:MAG: methyltransferase domain-containing protein [Candidatus Dormiibacterota bacterium]
MSAEHVWYHTIDLPDGTTTPGWFDIRNAPDAIAWPAGMSGGRCLDVGTFDGFWAFEMERRGAAEVVALDVDDPRVLDWSYDHRDMGPKLVEEWGSRRGPGFAEAARQLGSKAKRVNRSVYDLDPSNDGLFDVVFCGALIPHLQDPVRALERMRSVCRGEVVLVEHLDPHLEMLVRRLPAARIGPELDQWWRANSAGLVRMMELAGLEVTWRGRRFLISFGPGAPRNLKGGRLHALAAGRPGGRGLLYRAFRASPRPPRGS